MSDVELAPAGLDLSPCDHDLLSPTSRARGFCEACRIDRGLPVERYDYRRVSDPEPKLRAGLERGDHA